MKKLMWCLMSVFGLLGTAHADLAMFKTHTFQSAAGATGNGTPLAVDNYSTVGLQVVISDTATVTFEVTSDGTNWASAVCTASGDTAGTLVTTASASAAYQCNIAGYQQFRARVSSFTGGTITVTGRATTAVLGRKGGGGGGGGSGVASSITGSSTLPATCNIGDVYFKSDEPAGQQLYTCSALDTWSLSYEATPVTWAALIASGSATTSESSFISVRGTGGHTTTGWDIYTRTDGTPIISPVCAGVRDACDKGSVVSSTYKFFVEDASSNRMLNFEPNAASSTAQYALGAKKAKITIWPDLNPRGTATGAYESILTNQPNDYYITFTDSDSSAADFTIFVSTKMAGATTMTFRLVGVSKAASPANNIALDCAVTRFTPGTTTYTAHSTTGEVRALLTPATQNRPVAVTTSAHTINGGALVAGDVIKGSCEVHATDTTSTQMTDFRLEGRIGVTLDINSLSE